MHKICQTIAHSLYWAYSAYHNMQHMQNLSFNMQLYIKKYATTCTKICQIIAHGEYFACVLSYYCIYFFISLHVLHFLHSFCLIAAYFLAYSCIFSCIFCFYSCIYFCILHCSARASRKQNSIRSGLRDLSARSRRQLGQVRPGCALSRGYLGNN